MQEEKLDSCRDAGEQNAGCGCSEKAKRVLPAHNFRQQEIRGGKRHPLRLFGRLSYDFGTTVIVIVLGYFSE